MLPSLAKTDNKKGTLLETTWQLMSRLKCWKQRWEKGRNVLRGAWKCKSSLRPRLSLPRATGCRDKFLRMSCLRCHLTRCHRIIYHKTTHPAFLKVLRSTLHLIHRYTPMPSYLFSRGQSRPRDPKTVDTPATRDRQLLQDWFNRLLGIKFGRKTKND